MDKVTKEAKGSASKIEVKDKIFNKGKENEYKQQCVFWTSTKQTGEDSNGNASFNWVSEKNPDGKQVIMSLGDPDIGEILAVLNGVKEQVGPPNGKGIYHETSETANSSFKFSRIKLKPEQIGVKDGGYSMTISSKKDGQLLSVSHTLSLAEAEILKVILTDSVRRKYWVA